MWKLLKLSWVELSVLHTLDGTGRFHQLICRPNFSFSCLKISFSTSIHFRFISLATLSVSCFSCSQTQFFDIIAICAKCGSIMALSKRLSQRIERISPCKMIFVHTHSHWQTHQHTIFGIRSTYSNRTPNVLPAWDSFCLTLPIFLVSLLCSNSFFSFLCLLFVQFFRWNRLYNTIPIYLFHSRIYSLVCCCCKCFPSLLVFLISFRLHPF